MIFVLLCLVSVASGGPATESYKDQFCTDPRTGQRHEAYTEWADAYSCTRHRCQPGGRNLAIYTVGCKRIEAPESAIECEEVVEDTNMQFPFCCTRLRCLVLVRGEVWTRVLGQPWEALPAAPWSHMYKMKKPPPVDGGLPKPGASEGPVYEMADGENRDAAVMRAKAEPDCGDAPRTDSGPDIVIALGTHTDEDIKGLSDDSLSRHKKGKKASLYNSYHDDRRDHDADLQDLDNTAVSTEKPADSSDERFFANDDGNTPSFKSKHQPWTEIPSSQWNEQDPPSDTDSNKDKASVPQDTPYQEDPPKQEKGNLQALVNAIGTRMKDIEHVVEKMSKKVHHKTDDQSMSSHSRLRAVTSEAPLYLEDPKLNGYFSDASNGVVRSKGPKEPAETFMAIVDTRRKAKETEDKKHKKHLHKRKGKHHKKHHSKRFNRLTSAERNGVSDDSSAAVAN